MDESTFHTNSEQIKVLVKNTQMTYYIPVRLQRLHLMETLLFHQLQNSFLVKCSS